MSAQRVFEIEEEKLKEYLDMHSKYIELSQEFNYIPQDIMRKGIIDNSKVNKIKPQEFDFRKGTARKVSEIVNKNIKPGYVCKLTKSFVFDACHYLPYHDRKCKFIHGHTYHMDITVKGEVAQETGMVIDFGILKKIVEEEVLEKFDHGFLNEYIDYPTCEIMIFWIWKQLSKRLDNIDSIKVWETDGSCCEVTAADINPYLEDLNHREVEEE